MNDLSDYAAPIAVVVVILVLIAFLALIAKRLRRVPPNQALVIVGKGASKADRDATSGQKVVIGGRVFVWPILQEAFAISLEQRALALTVDGVDSNFIGTSVKATVLFKVRGDEDGVRRAAQRFMSQQNDVETPLRQALEGALRPIIGSMPVERLISDRDSLQEQVVASIKTDLAEQGFQVDLVNLSDIDTPGSDYLRNLGRAQAARARKEAEVAEAATRLESENARIAADEKVAERERDLALKKAGIKAETDRADAEALASGQLAQAEQDRLVAVQQREALAEKAKVTEEQLDIDVRKPAEARAYAQVQDANARRDADNAAAEADAYRRQKIAEANKIAALLDAEATEASGRAEAAAIEAKGLAEAASTDAQAKALAEQGQAVLAQQLIAIAPEIVRAAAEPISRAEGITIVSTEGASALTKAVTQVAAEGAGILGTIVPGLDLGALIGGSSRAAAAEPGAAAPAAAAAAPAAPTA